jgi:flavin reductase (DIM6/NTAB) family NADH-FMN oxidoreductase RutF
MTEQTGYPAASGGFDIREFRRALGTFVTGVTVVTTVDRNGTPRGFTANSFTSVSLEPPLVLVCLGNGLSSYAEFAETTHFAVNILAQDQKHVSSAFASRGVDRFGAVGWTFGELGDPVLEGTAAWFECSLHDRVEAGDHLILIGHVRSYGQAASSPLGYCRGAYVSFDLEQELIAARGRKTRIGAILESNGQVMFLREPGSERLKLPSGPVLGSPAEPASLCGRLAALSSGYDLDFLYSVYEDPAADTLNVYYRGTVDRLPDSPSVECYPLEGIPWDRLEDEAIRVMLKRYVNERLEARFSIYVGNSETGSYKAVLDAP